jgi:23S rRNA pseudouridine1911/1915/1917 synthase
MVALTERAHHPLVEQLAAREVERRYLALAWRPPKEEEGHIESAYGRDPRHRLKFTGRDGAKHASTDWWVEERFGRVALMRLKLHTGRTHQIRVHLSELGSPILADTLYGIRQRLDQPARLKGLGWELGLKRQALHAATLGFTHPITGERLSFEAPLPEDMARCLAHLRAARQEETDRLNALL